MLNREVHLHLYGCVSAEDLWDLGKDRHKDVSERMEWYASEFEKVFLRRPNWQAYWGSSDGLALLRKDFLFVEPEPFAAFQARFNLLIALNPPTPGNTTLLDHVLATHCRQGLAYAEYRTFLPPYWQREQLDPYLTAMAHRILKVEALTGGTFVPRLALSLQRGGEIYEEQYQFVRSWQKAHPKEAAAVTAIDFSHFEEGFPPEEKAVFFARVRADNKADPRMALQILYHVGESFEGMSIASAARWVWQAAALGADRLGHAIALGLDPACLAGRTVEESLSERLSHLTWLREQAAWLRDFGYQVDEKAVGRESAMLAQKASEKVPVVYTDTFVEDCRRLQEALLKAVAQSGVMVESCPTSNFRIARIPSVDAHPLKRFLHHGLRVCVSSDDPGIFDITLESEERLLRESFGLGDDDITELQKNALEVSGLPRSQ